MARLIAFVFLLSASSVSVGKLSANKLYGAKDFSFTFVDFCNFFGRDNIPFINVVSATQIDCMGKSFSVIEFCKKKLTDQNFVRGFIRDERVLCLSAQMAILKYECEGSGAGRCHSPEKTCQELQYFMANQLELTKAFVIKDQRKEHLNCYFSENFTNEKNERSHH